MNLRVILSLSIASLMLAACNGAGPKDELVARIGSENFYQSDLDFIAMKQRDWTHTPDYREAVSRELSRTALATKILQENPQLKEKWNAEFAKFEIRMLMVAYQQFFAMNNMCFTDSELRTYFQNHQSEFALDSTRSFTELRSKIAVRLFFETYADSLHNFRAKWAAGNSEADTAQADSAFVNHVKHEWMSNLGNQLREKHKVELQPLPEPDIQGYYDAHLSEFMTPPMMVLYHIQGADSARLAKRVSKIHAQDSAAFKALAAKYSENKETAANGGFVGKVKKGYALPYGIGMVDGLFEAFEGKPAGSISPVMRTSVGSFHVFYLDSLVAPEQKALARVKKDVEEAIERQNTELDSDYVLVTVNGQPAIRERDVMDVYASNNMILPSNMYRKRIMNMLAEGVAFATEARKLKLDKSWEYRAMVRESERSYVIDQYERLEAERDSVPEDTLKAVYEKYGNPLAHRRLSYEASRSDLIDFVKFPKNLILRFYYYSYDRYGNKPVEESLSNIIAENIQQYRNFRKERRIADAWSAVKYTPYRKNLEFKFDANSPENLIKVSDSLYKAKRLELAIDKLKRLRLIYPDNDSLFAWATFQLAQMESESDEDYDLSQAEYHAFYGMNPDHPDAEKAMFSRGFILNEHLHRDAEALEVLESFQKKYPNSELKESVDRLVNNIKSGGKLADDLMKKIEAEE